MTARNHRRHRATVPVTDFNSSKEADRAPEPRPMTDAQRVAEADRSARGLLQSTDRIELSLAVGCEECGAETGDFCRPNVRAFCNSRYEAGVIAAAARDAQRLRSTPIVRPGGAHPDDGYQDDLAQFAAEVRNAGRDATYRQRVASFQARRDARAAGARR